MQKDYRPYWLKKLFLKLCNLYCDVYLKPRFQHLGDFPNFMKPWYIKINGSGVCLGDCATIAAESDRNVSIGIWASKDSDAVITIGNHVLISPGVRITASESIKIGDSCMLASGVYISDSDWHGIYDRVAWDQNTKPIIISDNVWIGDHATILKGVTIGKNSIIAAGAVVTKDVPENTIFAGNPAVKVRDLDPSKGFYTRGDFFADQIKKNEEFDSIDKTILSKNSFWKWMIGLLFPRFRK